MSGFLVRLATSNDAPELAQIINAIIRVGGTTSIEKEFTPEALDKAEITGSSVICCYVAIEPGSNEIVAFQSLRNSPRLPNDVAGIGTFARIDRKQSGAGSALFAFTKKRAAEVGLKEINATIRADNVGGLAYYSKQGFVDRSVTPSVPLSNGTLIDRVNKRYFLENTGATT
jgi:RimJ/RimL family protein N-acetyltransferase